MIRFLHSVFSTIFYGIIFHFSYIYLFPFYNFWKDFVSDGSFLGNISFFSGIGLFFYFYISIVYKIVLIVESLFIVIKGTEKTS